MMDKTGQPPSENDVDEAEAIVRKMMVAAILKMPPELGVQMGNILRCLHYLKQIMPK